MLSPAANVAPPSRAPSVVASVAVVVVAIKDTVSTTGEAGGGVKDGENVGLCCNASVDFCLDGDVSGWVTEGDSINSPSSKSSMSIELGKVLR